MSLYHDSEDLQSFVEEWIEAPNADTVRQMRVYTGWGMMECKNYLNKAAIIYSLDRAETVEQLRELVKSLAYRVEWRI